MRGVVVLGATGSIGVQTLEVCDRLGMPVVALAAARGSESLHRAATRYPDAAVAVAAPNAEERERFAGLGERVTFGADAVVGVAGMPGTVVVNGIVGAAGLRPSVAALDAGNRLALANKESLVAGGPVVMAALERGGGELLPVDSEHSALHQLLDGADPAGVARLVLTASGGPFRDRAADEMDAVTVEEALNHPTWDMGPRITIDSATLMNKAFEVIEAHLLFGVDYDRIRVVVHPQSIVHALVEHVDGVVLAHLGSPDMRIPIAYALTHPDRSHLESEPFDLTATPLEFEEPDTDRFPCLALGYEAGRLGGSAPTVLNAADEMAVQAFLEGRIGFSSIPVIVERVLGDVEHRSLETVDHVLEADTEARAMAASLVSRC